MDHRIGLAAGVGIALLVSVLGIVAVFMGYLTDPNRPVQVFSQSPSEGERGYQGIFDAEIHRCASSQPDRPLGGRWNVEEKRVEMVPAGWSELEPLCSGDNLLWRSDARVDPSLGQYVQLQWSFPYDVSVAAVQSDWLAVSGTSSIANRPFVAYGYQTGYYVVDTTQSDLDKELWWGDSAPDSWGDITSVSVDRDAFAAGSGADERDMTAVLDDLSDSSYVVAVGAGVYGVYAVASVTGTDNRTISVSSVRGVGVPPDDGRVEVRFYPDGGSASGCKFRPVVGRGAERLVAEDGHRVPVGWTAGGGLFGQDGLGGRKQCDFYCRRYRTDCHHRVYCVGRVNTGGCRGRDGRCHGQRLADDAAPGQAGH